MGERELGTWLLSVAGILKGFLFNILVALKKNHHQKKKTQTPKLASFSEQERLQLVPVPHTRAEGGVGASCLPETQSSGAAIFIKIPVFAWQNSGLEKQ